MPARDWNPTTYERFKQERAQPFYDLLAMVEKQPHMRVVDLGCGPGTMTAVLHERLEPEHTLGLDSAAPMLAQASALQTESLRFENGDIEEFNGDEEYDLVFSNAAVQWTQDHHGLLGRIWWALRPGGQVAIQIPDNGSHPSQRVEQELAAEEPYRSLIANPSFLVVHPPEQYAAWLYELGFEAVNVRLQIYLHPLPSADAVVDWVKSSYLLGFKSQMSEPDYDRFVADYSERFATSVGGQAPYLFTFRRILMHARKP